MGKKSRKKKRARDLLYEFDATMLDEALRRDTERRQDYIQ